MTKTAIEKKKKRQIFNKYALFIYLQIFGTLLLHAFCKSPDSALDY